MIKTAVDGHDLEQVLQLRHNVYYEEILLRHAANDIDMDRFDLLCDHLMVVEKKSNSCVGTYRLNSSLFNNTFYSATEFHIENILALEGTKMELGRACIEKGYRNTLSIAMLWKGLIEYAKKAGSRYLFGCSSIKAVTLEDVVPIYTKLKSKHFSAWSCRVYPKRKLQFRNVSRHIKTYEKNHAAGSKPDFPDTCFSSLLKFYLRCGAVICGEPALDKDFRCTDFFTLLDITRKELAEVAYRRVVKAYI